MYLRDKQTILHKLVAELKYAHNTKYWEKLGRIGSQLEQTGDWMSLGDNRSAPNSFISLLNGTRLNITAGNFSLDLERTNNSKSGFTTDTLKDFSGQHDQVSSIIQNELNIDTVSRWGFRCFHLIAFNSFNDSIKWLESLSLINFNSAINNQFPSDRTFGDFALVVLHEGYKVRIGVSVVERQGQYEFNTAILNITPHLLSKNQNTVLIEKLNVQKIIHSNPFWAAQVDIDYSLDNSEPPILNDFSNSIMKIIESKIELSFGAKS